VGVTTTTSCWQDGGIGSGKSGVAGRIKQPDNSIVMTAETMSPMQKIANVIGSFEFGTRFKIDI